MQASACGARRALGEGLGQSGVCSAPAKRQKLRLSVEAHPGGPCKGVSAMERGGRVAPIGLLLIKVVLVAATEREQVIPLLLSAKVEEVGCYSVYAA